MTGQDGWICDSRCLFCSDSLWNRDDGLFFLFLAVLLFVSWPKLEGGAVKHVNKPALLPVNSSV